MKLCPHCKVALDLEIKQDILGKNAWCVCRVCKKKIRAGEVEKAGKNEKL